MNGDKTSGDVGVLIVDDQPAFRVAARAVVGAAGGFVVAGEADSVEAAIEAAADLGTGLVLMDIHLGDMPGTEACRRITAVHGGLVVLLMSTYPAEDLPADARNCGAAGYVHKEDLTPAVLSNTWAAHRK
jgi:DNA-binding NarL/FixJ family response regulator